MDSTRYYLVNKYPDFYPLDPKEIFNGYHYCPEWDYLVVGPDSPEWDLCTCFIKIQGVKYDPNTKDKNKGIEPELQAKDDTNG